MIKYFAIHLLLGIFIVLNGKTIFNCDFENEPLGTYTSDQMKAAWNNPTWENGLSEGRGEIVSNYTGKCLRIFYPQGTVGEGAKWEMDLGQLYDTLWVSYKLLFQEGFNFVRGGKLPGLGGGSTPTGGDTTTGSDGFSARIMWRLKNTGDGEQGAVCQYVYHMDKPGTYGEDLYWAYPNHGWSSTRRYFIPGEWHEVKTRVIINSPGEFNGRITSWLDGDLGLDSIIRFRDFGVTHFAVDKFLFSTFFGGSDSTWAPVKDEYIYFDDFLISTSDPNDISLVKELKSNKDYNIFQITQKKQKLTIQTRINLNLPITITDLKGRIVAKLNGKKGASGVTYKWDSNKITSGIYFILLRDRAIAKVSKL